MRMAANGTVGNKLPGTKNGKRWRFHKDAIDEWVTRGSGNPTESGNNAQ